MHGHLDRYRRHETRHIMSIESRRFPAPWRIRELAETFVVEDANRASVAYTYFDTNRMQSASANDKLTRDEARRVAANIAKLPDLLVRSRSA